MWIGMLKYEVLSWNRFGYIEIETALELTKYLAKEDELFIWNVVLSNLVPKNLESTLKNYELYPLLKVPPFLFFVSYYSKDARLFNKVRLKWM